MALSATDKCIAPWMWGVACLALLLVMVTLLHHSRSVQAQSGDFADGAGTPDHPYQIATEEHLNNVRKDLKAHYILIENIDLGVSPWNDGEGWEPIGSETEPFKGTFDGNGYTIAGLTIKTSARDVGLFGYTDTTAHIINVNLENVHIAGPMVNVGALVGHNSGTIENSQTTGVIKSTGISFGGTNAGGLIGINAGTVRDSWARVIFSHKCWQCMN